MSDMIMMTAEQLRERDMQVAKATESRLIFGGYVALSTSQITAIIDGVEVPVAEQLAGSDDAIALLGIWKTWLGDSREQCDENGKRLWDRIEVVLTSQPTVAMPTLQKPKHLRRKMRNDGGYEMVPAYTVEEMQEHARGVIAAALALRQSGLSLTLTAENQKRQEVEQQRDQLLAMLEEMLDKVPLTDSGSGYTPTATKARALIAAVKGGAV